MRYTQDIVQANLYLEHRGIVASPSVVHLEEYRLLGLVGLVLLHTGGSLLLFGAEGFGDMQGKSKPGCRTFRGLGKRKCKSAEYVE
jgi:hypothetical protein